MDWQSIYKKVNPPMTEEEIKTEAYVEDKMTRCKPEDQTKDKCTKFEAGRTNGNCWCLYYYEDLRHCGNAFIQNHCLRYVKK